MTGRRVIGALLVLVILSLLTACGPAVAPTPTPSPAPTEVPTDTPAPTPTPAEGPIAFREGFEEGLDRWERGADVPEDPDRPGQPVEWTIELSPDQAAEGASAARFSIDGKQDDGTIWLARPFDVAPDETVRVRLTFDLWSESESFNTLAQVAAYAGAQPPTAEGDFDLSRPANQAAGWRTYEYAFEARSHSEGQVWVALGISVVWETWVTYYVDDVRVDIAPAGEGQPPSGDIAIEGVEVSEAQIVIRGTSTLVEGSRVCAELWADGVPLSWWPPELCAIVQDGKWDLVVPLDAGQALQPGVQYMVRAYQPGGPDIVSTFPFDLDGPAPPPTPAPGDDAVLLLPDSAEVLSQAAVDLDGDGAEEQVFLTGFGGAPERLGYDFLQMFVIAADGSGGYAIAWQSEQLPTERAEPLQVQDVNGDSLPEVVSVQGMGASGEVLYLLGWQGDAYGWLTPQGGRFDGSDSFGENGVRVEDVDGAGLAEILASYGPAAGSTDVYAWDGEAYVYQETVGDAGGAYERVPVAEAGLSLEVPADWTQVDATTWISPEDEDLCLGVAWADLEAPQEVEAVMLPQPALVLDAEPVELPWGSGRRFTVEVYGEAAEGEGQAPVEAVEAHVLVVVDQGGTRRAFDVYAGAPSAEQLAALEPVLQRASTSVVFE